MDQIGLYLVAVFHVMNEMAGRKLSLSPQQLY